MAVAVLRRGIAMISLCWCRLLLTYDDNVGGLVVSRGYSLGQ
jgi:hypothetical protein